MLQGKMSLAHQIANLALGLSGASAAALVPSSDPTPPLPGDVNGRGTDPRGAGCAPVSLPQCVTPCSETGTNGRRVWG